MLTELETASVLRVSVNTLRKSRTDIVFGQTAFASGILPEPRYAGRRVFYAPDDVDAALAKSLKSLNKIISRKFTG